MSPIYHRYGLPAYLGTVLTLRTVLTRAQMASRSVLCCLHTVPKSAQMSSNAFHKTPTVTPSCVCVCWCLGCRDRHTDEGWTHKHKGTWTSWSVAFLNLGPTSSLKGKYRTLIQRGVRLATQQATRGIRLPLSKEHWFKGKHRTLIQSIDSINDYFINELRRS